MPVYFNEKTKKYYVAFYYTDWQGKRKKKKKEGFARSRDAKAFEQEFLNRQSNDCNMSFSQLSKYYLDDCSKRLKKTTLESKHYLFEHTYLPYFGDMPLNEITPQTIRHWQNEMLSSTKDYSPTYLYMVNNVLSAFFNYATKFFGLKENPVRIAGSMGSYKSKSMDFWTQDEFKNFIVTITDPATRLAFNLLFYCGMRTGELFALTIDDFSPVNNELRINKTLSVIKEKKVISTPKTEKSIRNITLPYKITKELQDYITLMYEPNKDDYLFPTLNKHNMRRKIHTYAPKAGVKIIRLHDLRHSHASLLIELNFPPLSISERLGHENIMVTLKTYSHLYPNKGTEIASKLDEII